MRIIKPRESYLKQKIATLLKRIDGLYFFKTHGSFYTRNLPDLICCYKGYFVAIEIKRDDYCKPTEAQVIEIDKIKLAKGTALIIRSVDEVYNILNGISPVSYKSL